MSWKTRAATAFALALALVALPVVLDQCATSCEAHRARTSSEPSCHHVAISGSRIEGIPLPCGHDHTGTVVGPIAQVAPVQHALDWTTAVQLVSPGPAYPVLERIAQSHAPPGSSLTLDSHSLPLRI